VALKNGTLANKTLKSNPKSKYGATKKNILLGWGG
jgi:hypothetical protein